MPAKPTVPPPARGERSAHHALLFGVARNKRALWSVAGLAVALAALVGVVLIYTDLSWATLTEWIDRVHPVAALPLMALLPIFGFPIAIVYLFAGARFGPVGGGAVVAAITAVHLLGTYLIAKSFLRARLQRYIARRHKHLPEVPEDEQAMVCVVATLVPGLPYFVRNYLLALGGVRLRYFFTVALPIYVARSYVTILLGDMGTEPSRDKLIILVIVDVLKVAICGFVIWRLRVHHRKFHARDHDSDHHDHPAQNGPGPDLAARAK